MRRVDFFLLAGLILILSCYFPKNQFFDHESKETANAEHRSITFTDGDQVWIEAEGGAEHNPMIVKSDQTASGQIYLASWDANKTALDMAPEDGNIIFSFNIKTEGDYRLWARAITPADNANSYWIRVDADSWRVWENISLSEGWGWDYYQGVFQFSPGQHQLIIAYREANTKIDKIMLTSDLNYIPTGLGQEIPAPTGVVTAHSNVVELNGNLQLINNQLCNEAGQPVQLKGLSTHGIQWFPVYKGHTIPNLVNQWGIDIIRIAMYVEDWYNGDDFWNGYLAHPEEMKQWTMDLVDDAIKCGIYVIIDWHIHNNPSNFTAQAKSFFAEMSSRYSDYPNVLYEIANEVIGGVAWSTVKDYAQQVIPEIRANDPDNIIIVGTPNWSQYTDLAAADPITGFNNIAYSLHFYAASHKDDILNRAKDAVLGSNLAGNNPMGNRIPLIATEWGTSDYDATYNDFTWSEIWLDFLEDNLISWCNWSFSNKDEASSILVPEADIIGPWQESDYTDSGLWVMEWMNVVIPPPPPPPQYQLGDVNHDGLIDILDALSISQYETGYNPVNFDISLADVNHDGLINNTDALMVAQYYVGLIDSF